MAETNGNTTRRSILRTGGVALAGVTGVAVVGSASASYSIQPGDRVMGSGSSGSYVPVYDRCYGYDQIDQARVRYDQGTVTFPCSQNPEMVEVDWDDWTGVQTGNCYRDHLEEL